MDFLRCEDRNLENSSVYRSLLCLGFFSKPRLFQIAPFQVGLCENRAFFNTYLETLSFFSSLSFHISLASFVPNLIVFHLAHLEGRIVLVTHECKHFLPANAGQI